MVSAGSGQAPPGQSRGGSQGETQGAGLRHVPPEQLYLSKAHLGFLVHWDPEVMEADYDLLSTDYAM